MSFTLQFNLAGAWRNVLAFEDEQLETVTRAAIVLLRAAGHETTSIRVTSDGGEVRLICDRDGRHDWPFRRSA